MDTQALSANELRIILGVLGVVVIALIYYFGRPKKPGQGKRILFKRGGARIEPTLGEGEAEQGELKVNRDEVSDEFHTFGEARSNGSAVLETAPPRDAHVGVRPPQQPIERIVTLFVTTRGAETIPGSDLVVAAEKAGLQFGNMNIFHRPVAGRPEAGPIFSVANMVKPGSFDMSKIDELQTPGVTFFMTLPGPLPALDAWDAMLPCAQRLAELLDGNVLDEERNALGRQRVAHIRDELRAFDRKQERNNIKPNW